MATEGNGGSNVAMAILVVALIAVVGIFVYFMATNHQQNTVIQMPTPQMEGPKVEAPSMPGKSQ